MFFAVCFSSCMMFVAAAQTIAPAVQYEAVHGMPQAITLSRMASSVSFGAFLSPCAGVSLSMVYIITLSGLMLFTVSSHGATYSLPVLSTLRP